MSGYCPECCNTICLCIEEKVLICKKTGELMVKTNKIKGTSFDNNLAFMVLDCGGIYLSDWYDDMFEDLGEL